MNRHLSAEEKLRLKRGVKSLVMLRKESGISQREMAQYCKITQSSICAFEHGRANNLYLYLKYTDRFIRGIENVREV